MPTIDLLLYLILINISIGIFVFAKNPGSKQNLSFALILTGTALWLAGLLWLDASRNFFWPDKLAHVGGIILAFGFYTFSLVFPKTPPFLHWKEILLGVWPLAIILTILPFNLIVRDVNFANNAIIPINGPLFPLFVSIYCYFAIRIFLNLLSKFKLASGIDRQKIIYVFVGLALFSLFVLVSDIILPEFNVSQFKFLGPYASLFFVILSLISIISYRLMDVRVLLKSLFVNLCAGLLVLFLAIYIYESELKHHLWSDWLIALIFTLPILCFLAVRYLLELFVDRLFLKNYLRSIALLNELNNRLTDQLDSDTIIKLVSEYLKQALDLKWIKFIEAKSFDRGESMGDREGYPTAHLPVRVLDEPVGYFVLGPQSGFFGLSYEQTKMIETITVHVQTAYARAILYQDLEDKVDYQVNNLVFKNKQLNEVMKNHVDFLQIISHQLRSPITSLKGSLELLQRDKIPNKQRKELIELAYTKAKDMANSFVSILGLVKAEKSPLSAVKETVDLKEVFETILKVIKPKVEEKKLKFEINYDECREVVGNKIYLEQAFFNLLENAVLNTSAGGVAVSFKADDRYITTIISDSGGGIPKSMVRNIFKKNTKGKNSKGYGIGLYVVRSIVRAHPHGHIWFETSSNGTSFYVRLARAKLFL